MVAGETNRTLRKNAIQQFWSWINDLIKLFMNTPEPSKQPKSPTNKNAESGKDLLTDTAMIEFTSVLDDFMDEEVVDKEGAAIGTLACYWQSVSGRLVFLGIKLKGHEGVRVVPGHRSQVDERNACLRLGFDAEDIESAPQFDCATEVDAALDRAVCEHFEVEEAEPHGGLRYFSRQS